MWWRLAKLDYAVHGNQVKFPNTLHEIMALQFEYATFHPSIACNQTIMEESLLADCLPVVVNRGVIETQLLQILD